MCSITPRCFAPIVSAPHSGIPYASPPVGELRWRPPQPVHPWEGVKITRRYGPEVIMLFLLFVQCLPTYRLFRHGDEYSAYHTVLVLGLTLETLFETVLFQVVTADVFQLLRSCCETE